MSERVHIRLRIEGMTCNGCAQHVTEALKAIPGVETALVGSWRMGEATVVAKLGVTNADLACFLHCSHHHAVLTERREV